MRALVVWSTPTSLHYDLFAMGGAEEELLLTGRIEGIGSDRPEHNYSYGIRGRGEGATRADNHAEALERLAAVLESQTTGQDDEEQRLAVLAHRVTHGGERFKGPARVSDEVLRSIDACSALAPRHNPAALLGIRAARHLFPTAPHVVVFDTAFHQTMSHEAFLYPLPYELYDRVGIRRFGFHGLSHEYAIRRAAEHVGRPLESMRVVSLHLGHESSAASVVEGRCVDTTTGLTSTGGLPGATSSGDLDPAVLSLLSRVEGLGTDELETLLASQSGVFGLSGVSSDVLNVVDLATKGDDRCAVAVRVYTYGIAKALGALAVSAGGLDLLVLTGEVAERSSMVRAAVCERLGLLGLALDSFRNEAHDPRHVGSIEAEGSSVEVVVVPADQQRSIAREALALVTGRDPA